MNEPRIMFKDSAPYITEADLASLEGGPLSARNAAALIRMLHGAHGDLRGENGGMREALEWIMTKAMDHKDAAIKEAEYDWAMSWRDVAEKARNALGGIDNDKPSQS